MITVERPAIVWVHETQETAEHPFLTYFPIQWEQNRDEVLLAIKYHRWACLKIRQLSRQQAAIDRTQQPGYKLWQWSKRIGRVFFGDGPNGLPKDPFR